MCYKLKHSKLVGIIYINRNQIVIMHSTKAMMVIISECFTLLFPILAEVKNKKLVIWKEKG